MIKIIQIESLRLRSSKNDGKPAGPYDLNTLKSMLTSGDVKSESLVWKEGMSEWQKAGIQTKFSVTFPPII